MTDLAIIVAKARNNTIGKDNQIPWHLPADLRHFKAVTMDCPIIMGRKTWDSLPRRPLPGRPHFIVSRTAQIDAVPGVYWFTAPETAFAAALAWARVQKRDAAYVIGGAALYALALEYAHTLHITQLDMAYEGDVFFPEIDETTWEAVKSEPSVPEPADSGSISYRIEIYKRRPQADAKRLIQIL